METKKIAIACFIGGLLCSAVALIFTPNFWWLGLIAGLAGGYLSYEFREVLRAIPVALHAARKGGGWAWEGLVERLDEVRYWLHQPHPFLFPAAVISYPLYIWGTAWFFGPANGGFSTVEGTPLVIVLFFCFVVPFVLWAACIELMMAVALPMLIFTFIGARVGEKVYWWPSIMPGVTSYETTNERLEVKGLQQMSMTYSNVYRWMAKGLGISILFFVWTLWKHVAIGLWTAVCFFGRFVWQMFKLIHSKKRVLCAIHGTLGGLVSYIWLVSESMSFAQQTMLVIFGGFLGALFGIAAWEIVSKRILQVTKMEG
ncbi:MAG: hypothetical protein V1695_03535 [Candidatus Uhrbacteria bacterium]